MGRLSLWVMTCVLSKHTSVDSLDPRPVDESSNAYRSILLGFCSTGQVALIGRGVRESIASLNV